ncbi:hypothetical protein [Acaryochloris marina]|uniref:hypothetical protein n=1 Tax=Acaryochloris marina TaxID=155978 RepID=UPI0011D06FCD|nr:hypothetical protein [Acaryochloris marina]
MPDSTKKINIDYIKSNFFRVFHVDGLGVQITPNLDIQIISWSERASIPKRVVFEINREDGESSFVKEEFEDRGSIVREVDASLTVTPEIAHQFIERLQEVLEELKAISNKKDTEEASEDTKPEDNS